MAMLIASMLIFGTIGIFRKSLPLSSGVLAFCRAVLGSLFLLILMILRGNARAIFQKQSPKKLLGLALSGALIGFNWILLFEAYNYTSVACATLCYYMQPIIVIVLSPFVFQERLTVKKCLCVILAMIGMIFVSGIGEKGFPITANHRGIIYGLSAAFLYACVVILNKKLTEIDIYEKTIVQLFFAAVTMIPYLLLTENIRQIPITLNILPILLIVGIVHTGIAYALYFASIDQLKTQTIAILGYIDPVTALVLSCLILHESLSFYSVIGAILILGAAFFNET